MPTRNLSNLFAGWEGELKLLIDTGPTQDEFWSYWAEREAAVEQLVTPELEPQFETELERLFAIAEAHGYLRPTVVHPALGPVMADPVGMPDVSS